MNTQRTTEQQESKARIFKGDQFTAVFFKFKDLGQAETCENKKINKRKLFRSTLAKHRHFSRIYSSLGAQWEAEGHLGGMGAVGGVGEGSEKTLLVSSHFLPCSFAGSRLVFWSAK